MGWLFNNPPVRQAVSLTLKPGLVPCPLEPGTYDLQRGSYWTFDSPDGSSWCSFRTTGGISLATPARYVQSVQYDPPVEDYGFA